MPIDHRMHSHESRPPGIRLIEVGQQLPMRIGPSRPDQNRFNIPMLIQISLERLLHGHSVPRQIQLVCGNRGIYEFVDLGERVRGDDVDGLQGRGEGGLGLPGESAEEENEEDEAVFAAVVGE